MWPHQLLIAAGLSLIVGLTLSWHWLPAALLLALVVLWVPLPRSLRVAQMVGLLIAFALAWYQTNQVATALPVELGTPTDFRGVVVDEVSNGTSRSTTIKIIDPPHLGVRARIYTYDQTAFGYGDTIVGQLKFTPPPTHIGSILKDKVFHQAQVLGIDEVVPPTAPSPRRLLFDLRDHLASQSETFLPANEADLLGGLLFGLRQNLSSEFADNLRRSGTSHIIALSGYNIAVVISCFVWALGVLPRRPRLVVSGLAIIAFVLMTGASSSVVRAGIMGCALLLTSIWGRRGHAGASIVLAASLMIIANPLALIYDIGFQLSLLATCGIVFLSPIFSLLLGRLRFRWLIDLLSATLSATLSVLPLTLFYFGGISLLGLVANLVIVPAVPVAMGLGGVGILLAAISPIFLPISAIAYFPLHFIGRSVNFFGSLPSSFVELPQLAPIWVVVGYSFLLGLTIWVNLYHARPKS